MSECPFISIVNPCRNEEDYIDRCLASVVANDYLKHRFEVSVADRMSREEIRTMGRIKKIILKMVESDDNLANTNG